jgi:ribonuclease HI
LEKLQRIATLAITGGLRSTPTDLLDAHAGLLPLGLAMKKTCHRAAVWLLSLPKTNPLHSKVKDARRSPPRAHFGPIDTLVKTFRLSKTRVETISPVTDRPHDPCNFVTRIADSREASIQEERKDAPDFKVFTDGSDHDGGVGAAAVMYKTGYPVPISQLKARLGPSTKHNNYEAEIAGGILATWLIANTPETYRKAVCIYADNQPFIKAAANPKAAPGQYLLQNFNRGANSSHAKIKLKWISGHSEVRGNEMADRLAKEAASGRASRHEELPPIFQRTLPTSVSSKNREHMDYLKEEWAEMWQESPRRHRFKRVDDTFPFNGYRKRQNKLSRAHTSLLMQVRSRHLPLNSYLHRINKAESDRCLSCRARPDDETPPETIEHFIYNCDAYTMQRRSLIRAVGVANLPLKDIMMETKRMKELARYIIRTGRFKKDG